VACGGDCAKQPSSGNGEVRHPKMNADGRQVPASSSRGDQGLRRRGFSAYDPRNRSRDPRQTWVSVQYDL